MKTVQRYVVYGCFCASEPVVDQEVLRPVQQILEHLDWLRKNRRKFICLNDDIDHSKEDSKLVRDGCFLGLTAVIPNINGSASSFPLSLLSLLASLPSFQSQLLMQDFYLSMFPTTSQFELPPNYRNRFLYVKDLNEW